MPNAIVTLSASIPATTLKQEQKQILNTLSVLSHLIIATYTLMTDLPSQSKQNLEASQVFFFFSPFLAINHIRKIA